MTDYTPEDEAAARAWAMGMQGLPAYFELVQSLARFHASARSQGREAGLEEAAREVQRGAKAISDQHNPSRDVKVARMLGKLAAAIRALKSEPSRLEEK